MEVETLDRKTFEKTRVKCWGRRMAAGFLLGMLLSLLTFLPRPAGAATAAQTVSYKSGDETVHGLLYLPAGGAAKGGKHPAIIVIHEFWGLNDWVKQQAEELAGHGYVTLAVDLYRGQVATDPETAHELMRGLPQDRGVRDLVAAAAYLRGRKDVDPERVGAIGWCMGGGYAAQLAIADPKLRAVSINYGALPTDPAALTQIHAAVLGNFGGQDKGIPPASVDAFAAALKKLGKQVDVKIYPDAGHAFENPNNKTGYRQKDAEDAQRRSVNFFATTLGGTGE
jgi:carboxymethylenebutenolidase